MKNLLLLIVLSAIISSCEKEYIEVYVPVVDTVLIVDTVFVDTMQETNIEKALAGELCTYNGYQVFVKQDTLFARYFHYNTHADTVWYTEFYYYEQDGSTVWCNEDYLIDCE